MNGDDVLLGTDGNPGAITRVSTDSAGVAADRSSTDASFSPDGTKVVFASRATNLDGPENAGVLDVFIKDLVTGEVTLLSRNAGGAPGNDRSLEPAFSPDGTKVVFASEASNLVPGDTNGARDIFVKDLITGEISRVSNDAAGVEGNAKSFNPEFSPDGTKVVFYSWSSNFSANDDNALRDIYVKDLVTGEVTLVSQNAAGVVGDRQSTEPVFSPDGTKIAFASWASNLVPGDTNGEQDVFVKDLVTGEVVRISTSAAGKQGNEESGQYYMAIVFSPDGTKVAFASEASNLVGGDTNGVSDIFVKDLVTGEVMRVSTSASGGQADGESAEYNGKLAFSPDGNKLVFTSRATNLVAGDTNGRQDVFVKDLVTGAVERLSTSADGVEGLDRSSKASFSADGTYVVFQSEADNLVPGDTGQQADIFIKAVTPSGADLLDGRAGDDQIFGSGGNDVLIGGKGDDLLDGGDGWDTASYGKAKSGVSVSLAIAGAQDTGGAGTDTLVSIESLTGSDHADALTGSDVANTLNGGGGDDTLVGLGDNDVLLGGAGDDLLDGSDGVDTASYAEAAASVAVDLGLVGAQDTGAAGTDTLLQVENLIGTQFDDVLRGSAAGNRLIGGAGKDTLFGFEGDDILLGGAESDILEGGAGDDFLDGDEGYRDMASYRSATSGVTVSLYHEDDGPQQTGGAGTDRLEHIEGLIGSAYNDVLIGGYGANYSYGEDGDDVVEGRSGDDWLWGGAGTDDVLGGAGDDWLWGDAGNDRLDGGAGDDILRGGAGNDLMTGDLGNDTYYVDAGGDVILDSGGIDTVSASISFHLDSALENLTLTGSEAIDGKGNKADNVIVGNAQANVLSGKGGTNTLTGNGGEDTFVFDSSLAEGATLTTITDFLVGTDTVALSRSVFTEIGAAGELADGRFTIGTGAQDADDRVIYNLATGALWYDADGTGAQAATHFGTLTPGLALSASDFTVIS